MKTLVCAMALLALVGCVRAAQAAAPTAARPRLFLLVARFSHPWKDLAAATLGWLCKEKGVAFDAYYAVERPGGGIFDPHGSTVVGGRHSAAIGRALAAFDTTVVRLDDTAIFAGLLQAGARATLDAKGDLVGLYERAAADLGIAFPQAAVAVQTQGLPKRVPALPAFAFPEAVYRKALAVPLELDGPAIGRLAKLGVRELWTVAAKDADAAAWRAQGLEPKPAEELPPEATYGSVTARIVRRWLPKADAVDLFEPILAAHLVPFSIRENRLVLCDSVAALLPLLKGRTQSTIYCRYGGGAARLVGHDRDFYPAARENRAVQVIEPGRPVLTVFGGHPAPLPQPAQSCFDLEPADGQLEQWAKQGKILATWVLHSGELAHDDAVLSFLEWSALTKVKIGSGVWWQRYTFDPDCVEPMHVPVAEGGVLGLVEPVLHSAGCGNLAETLGEPAKVAALMKDSRRRIAHVAGERFAPRGVYCYRDMDGDPKPLWRAVREAGFDYLISSAQPGDNRLLYSEGDFVVLNQAGGVMSASPFTRVKELREMSVTEEKLAAAKRPGWLIGVLDSPLYGYSSYLATGHKWGGGVRINAFYDYLAKGGTTGQVLSATPHTIARYARLLARLGIVATKATSAGE